MVMNVCEQQMTPESPLDYYHSTKLSFEANKNSVWVLDQLFLFNII